VKLQRVQTDFYTKYYMLPTSANYLTNFVVAKQ